MIEVNHLSKFYGAQKVLDDLSFTLPPGQVVGLLGQNGAGKTTLLKILTGLVKNYIGDVRVCGHALGIETKKITAYNPDHSMYPPNSHAKQLIGFYQDFFKDFDRNKALELLQAFKIPLKEPLKSLSKGTQEKLQLILTLSRNAQVFVFDEPLGGVDLLARLEILNLIVQQCNKQATLLLSTHLLLDVQSHLDMAMFIQSGHIIALEKVEILQEKHGSLKQAYQDLLNAQGF
ncbi:ATP-binding cassette domain-containing protein [Helicobacter suis]|uniref:ATP-binding cassette domain-containing protein n=1 Tax=Helicobacter suis TaxID=104628 RepID=UPI0013D44A9F|nr:ABC transporter ATP-binding protein [Helicobacter suis]